MSPRGPPIATRCACVDLSEGACVRVNGDIFMYADVHDLMYARYVRASVYAHACLHACMYVCMHSTDTCTHTRTCMPAYLANPCIHKHINVQKQQLADGKACMLQ